jgi:putative flippase GtrA
MGLAKAVLTPFMTSIKNNIPKSSIATIFTKHQIKVRFIVVGIWNTIFGYLVFVGLDTFFAYIFFRRYVAYMTAMVLSNIIAISNAFIFHKYITFKSPIKGIGIIFEYFKFFTTYIITFCISLVLLPLFVELCNVSPKVAGAFVILVCTVISYFGHSRFSFRS